jgi:SAM-dependent methyltransferase
MLTANFNKTGFYAKRTGRFRVLDVGCGSGRHMGGACQRRRTVVIGTDLNRNDLVSARQRLDELDQLGFNQGVWALSAADIIRLPFDDNTFDLVICSEVLEHIAFHKQAVAEIIRVLRPDRHLIVSVPRYYPERICWALSHTYRSSSGGHVRIYRKNDLISAIENGGANFYYLHYAHGLHTPYWWLKCLLGPAREHLAIIKAYHRLLTWDLMKKPKLIRLFEHLLNPLMGKSLVLYFRKRP